MTGCRTRSARTSGSTDVLDLPGRCPGRATRPARMITGRAGGDEGITPRRGARHSTRTLCT